MSAFVKVNQIAQTVESLSADPGEEFPFLHTITVVDRVVSVDKPELVQNNIRTETVTLNLDSEWDGLSCIINIGSGKTPTSLIWSGKPVIIPAELMTDIGTLNVSVVGYGDNGTVRAVTKKADAMFVVAASGYVHDDTPVPDPTTILGQLVEAADNANQAAQNAEDSTIDKVNVTMLPTGSSASGSVADKTLSLSIPNGPQGPRGPKGDPGDLTTVAHDSTLTGDGTTDRPLKIAAGSLLTQDRLANGDLNQFTESGLYSITDKNIVNAPDGLTDFRGTLIVFRRPSSIIIGQMLLNNYSKSVTYNGLYLRSSIDNGSSWRAWERVALMSDASTSRMTKLEARVQALEAKLANK